MNLRGDEHQPGNFFSIAYAAMNSSWRKSRARRLFSIAYAAMNQDPKLYALAARLLNRLRGDERRQRLA